METKTATLIFIKSVNPPVFRTPLEIYYTVDPKVGEAFLFGYRGFYSCNFSTIRKITKFDGFMVIRTRNSSYLLITEEYNG